MFDKLEDVCKRYEELQLELSSPEVTSDTNRFRKLMKEQSDCEPLVTAYTAYKKAKQTVSDSLEMLEAETDPEMRDLLKEEISDAKARIEEYEKRMKILLIPKDPNDDKNVVMEIRAGAGGEEAALFAAELYRMYVHYI
ncbi:MAG: PCRF domain-containing protein, partial [Lachnospiraceae bacterium]|nr:PCRF domain-containing protein [Lachnospiraceae bacterium]